MESLLKHFRSFVFSPQMYTYNTIFFKTLILDVILSLTLSQTAVNGADAGGYFVHGVGAQRRQSAEA